MFYISQKQCNEGYVIKPCLHIESLSKLVSNTRIYILKSTKAVLIYHNSNVPPIKFTEKHTLLYYITISMKCVLNIMYVISITVLAAQILNRVALSSDAHLCSMFFRFLLTFGIKKYNLHV